jgi:two-component system response regulator CpxR
MAENKITMSSRATKLLLVDDDEELGRLLKLFFSAHPVELEVCGNGRDGLRLALEGGFDAIVLDVMLPTLDGFEVLRQIRRRSTVPVLMLTARTEHEDRMAGFKAGADDYLPKPFHPEELLARCQAMLRRLQGAGAAEGAKVLEIGGLTLDNGLRQAFSGGESLELTGMEFEVLEILARASGRVVTRDEIWACIHQRELSPFERALDTHMSKLRRKLNGRSSLAIRTVRNSGYLLSVTA